MTDSPPSSLLAAIDLGSNSFRLEAGCVREGVYRRHHCRKEMVSLGAGLDASGHLSREAIDRGLRCLRRFVSDLAALDPQRVRIVATQTLREARNRNDFLRRAEALLELPIEVISGEEEARLIHVGVSVLHPSQQRRLVIDIGGRSTELIIGQGRRLEAATSFEIGSASLSQRFFPEGRMSAEAFRAAQQAVRAALGQGLEPFTAPHWREALASSGTASSVGAMLKRNDIGSGTLTPQGLRWLIERCVAAGSVDRLDLPGLKDKRRPVLPGGLSILYTLVALCGIRTLKSSKGALRQGVIIDLHERQRDTDLAMRRGELLRETLDGEADVAFDLAESGVLGR